MARIFPIVRKVVSQVVGGATSWLQTVRPAIATDPVVSGVADVPVAEVGVAVSQGPGTVRIDVVPSAAIDPLATTGAARTDVEAAVAAQEVVQGLPDTPEAIAGVVASQVGATGIATPSVVPAVATQALAAVGTGAKPVTAPALAQSLVGSRRLGEEDPAVDQWVFYDLVHRSGASAVSEEAVGGRTDWASDANATGDHNGSDATIAGNALGARNGRLVLDFADFPNKHLLIIDSVKLHFYSNQAGTIANNGDLKHQWRRATGGAWTTLATHTGNVDFMTTPQTFDITASIGSWKDLEALQAGVEFNAAVAELQTAAVDAVEIEIVAHLDFSPSAIPGLTAWWRADHLGAAYADAVAIDSAVNVQGNADYNIASTGTSRPLQKLNILNGKPVARFDGSNDLLFRTAPPPTLSGTRGSLFAVVTPLATKQHAIFAYVRSGVTTDRLMLIVGSTGVLSLQVSSTGNPATIVGTAGGAIVSGTTYLIEAHSDGATTELWINGVKQTLINYVGSNVGRWWGALTSPNLLEVGFWTNNSTNQDFWNGDIAEMLLYDGVALTDRAKLHIRKDYLAEKYAIAV